MKFRGRIISWQKSLWLVIHWYRHLFLKLENSVHDYRQISNIRRSLAGNKIVDHSDVIGASPVGAAPTTSSLST